jgi:uncharacterized membrane protein
MNGMLLAVLAINTMWYALPLVVAVSLVYAATRHEQMEPIFGHAARIAAWIAGFMGIVFAVIWVVSWLARST